MESADDHDDSFIVPDSQDSAGGSQVSITNYRKFDLTFDTMHV